MSHSTFLDAYALPDLGAQAVQIITSSDTPLTILTQLSQNFPKYMTNLARRVVVNESLADGLHDNSLRVQRGLNMMWVNGLQVDAKDLQPLGILKLLKKERGLVDNLVAQGLNTSQAFELLTHPAIVDAQRGGAAMDAVFDASDRPEGGDVIVWWNDMEADKRCASYTGNADAFTVLTCINHKICALEALPLWCKCLKIQSLTELLMLFSRIALAANVPWSHAQHPSEFIQYRSGR